MLAVTQSGKVGIDVEMIRAVNLDDFRRHLPELAGLPGQCDADYINNAFFDLWTQKEAVLKGYGAGLSAPMEQVVLKGNTAQLYGVEWHVKKLSIDDSYRCHVASDRPDRHRIDRICKFDEPMSA